MASRCLVVDRRVLALWRAKIFAETTVLVCVMVVGCGLLVCCDAGGACGWVVQTVLLLLHHDDAADMCVVVVWECVVAVLMRGVLVVG